MSDADASRIGQRGAGARASGRRAMCARRTTCAAGAGVVESIAGHFANPEELAYGRDGLPAARALPRALPPGASCGPTIAGPPADTAVVDLYEHWLEPRRTHDRAPRSRP